jgi:hypothetical protein
MCRKEGLNKSEFPSKYNFVRAVYPPFFAVEIVRK